MTTNQMTYTDADGLTIIGCAAHIRQELEGIYGAAPEDYNQAVAAVEATGRYERRDFSTPESEHKPKSP